MTFSALVLDVGGVFLVPHPALVSEAFAAVGIAVGDFDAARAHFSGVCALREDAEDGRSDQGDYLRGYVGALDIPAVDRRRAVEAFAILWKTLDVWSHVLADSVLGLRLLAERALPLAVVSNSDGTVEERLVRHAICQVGHGPGVSVLSISDSAVIGVEKPDPRAFAHAIRAVGLTPDQIAYVGDSVRHDVLGARSAGLVPIHFDPYGWCQSADRHRHIRSLSELAP
jgi:putative hydrolase of the HAD superfamily